MDWRGRLQNIGGLESKTAKSWWTGEEDYKTLVDWRGRLQNPGGLERKTTKPWWTGEEDYKTLVDWRGRLQNPGGLERKTTKPWWTGEEDCKTLVDWRGRLQNPVRCLTVSEVTMADPSQTKTLESLGVVGGSGVRFLISSPASRSNNNNIISIYT